MAVDLERVPQAERAAVRRLTRQNEADFQQQVIDLAIDCHWGWPDPKGRVDRTGRPSHHGGIYHTRNSQGSSEGFPDLVMVHIARRLVLFAEVKTEGGGMDTCQAAWATALGFVAVDINQQLDGEPMLGQRPSILVRGWQPSDWPEIERVLTGAQ